MGGAVLGFAGGMAGGFVSSVGFTALGGGNFQESLMGGVKGAAIGGAAGAVSGGLFGGTKAYLDGKNVWSGETIADGRGAFSFKNTPAKGSALKAFGGNEFATESNTTLYRVASDQEYTDIQNNGIRVNPNGTGYQDGKLFYTSYEDALKGQALFQNAYGQTSTIVKVTYPTTIVNNSFSFQADGMNAIMINSLNLNKSILIRYK